MLFDIDKETWYENNIYVSVDGVIDGVGVGVGVSANTSKHWPKLTISKSIRGSNAIGYEQLQIVSGTFLSTSSDNTFKVTQFVYWTLPTVTPLKPKSSTWYCTQQDPVELGVGVGVGVIDGVRVGVIDGVDVIVGVIDGVGVIVGVIDGVADGVVTPLKHSTSISKHMVS